MKKFKINGTIKEDVSLQHVIKHLTIKVGCSYSEDIELDNIDVYSDGTFDGIIYSKNKDIDDIKSAIDENLTGSLYDIDTYNVSEL